MKADTDVEGAGSFGNAKHFNSTHGYASGPKKSRIYITWLNMKSRCRNPNSTHYSDYGERGISVCDRWVNSFESFLEDMGIGKKGWTIERIRNNEGYHLFNCVWADRVTQANNRRSSVFLEFGGRKQTVAQWASERGIAMKTLHKRISDGWSVPEALTTPVRKCS